MEISIIVPVHNRATIVNETLNSIASQTYRPIPLILVDNASTDNSLRILNQFKQNNESPDFRISVTSEPKTSACAARNTGANLATSKWIMFFDSDDLMDDYLVARYAKTINDIPDADMVACKADAIDSYSQKSNRPFYENRLMENHILHAIFATQRYIIRRSLYNKSGGWDERIYAWDDWELGIRIILQNPNVAFINDCTPGHIICHPNSITGNNFHHKAGLWEQAIDIAEQDSISSNPTNKDSFLKYILYKRVTLAGLYLSEGHRSLAYDLYKSASPAINADRTIRWLCPILFRYIGSGGVGASQIFKRLVK